MIKAIILDIDGVIIGGRPGFNFPLPNSKVIEALQVVSKKGIFISLCTAKPGFAIEWLIKKIGLDGIHIASGGAEIKNYFKKKFSKKHLIDNDSAKKFVEETNRLNLYSEVYTSRGYAILSNRFCKLTRINISILKKKPTLVKSLRDFISDNEIIKIMPAAYNNEDKQIIEKIMKKFPNLQLGWGENPMYAPTLFGVITARGVNKKSGAYEISRFLKIPFSKILGVGDGLSDWEFIKLCRYGATLRNGSAEIKKLVLEKGKSYSYVGSNVDDNGVLDIFRFFNLI